MNVRDSPLIELELSVNCECYTMAVVLGLSYCERCELSVNSCTMHLNAMIICLQYPVCNGCHKTARAHKDGCSYALLKAVIIFFVGWLFREAVALFYPGNLGPDVVGIKSDCMPLIVATIDSIHYNALIMQKFKYFTMHKYLSIGNYNIMKMNLVHVRIDTDTR